MEFNNVLAWMDRLSLLFFVPRQLRHKHNPTIDRKLKWCRNVSGTKNSFFQRTDECCHLLDLVLTEGKTTLKIQIGNGFRWPARQSPNQRRQHQSLWLLPLVVRFSIEFDPSNHPSIRPDIIMLSSREANAGPAVSFKTPGPTTAKRRAFGDISNRKPPLSAAKNHHDAGKAAAAVTAPPPDIVKPTTTTAKKQQQQTIVVPKKKVAVSFEYDDDDDVLEFPAGRMGKDQGKDAWLYLDDVFAELNQIEKTEQEEIAAAYIRQEQELVEREHRRQLERKMEHDQLLVADDNDGTCCAFSFALFVALVCLRPMTDTSSNSFLLPFLLFGMDWHTGSFLRQDFEKYCSMNFDDDDIEDSSYASSECDALVFPVIEI
jgi:hypothetical protein